MTKCNICTDAPCKNDVCKNEPYKIENCDSCPAFMVCEYETFENSCACQFVRNKIEALINGRKN